MPNLAAPDGQLSEGRLEPKTPMRKRELVPRSTAQPSTRRVRRLDGEKLAAANPLFQPWTTESPKKVLDFSRNISPRKSEVRSQNIPHLPLGELQIGRRQTRNAADSSVINSTLINTTLSDHDSSSSSLSEIDIGDVTLPASLQLANQPTEFSQRMARLRNETCITILEDSVSDEAPDTGEQDSEPATPQDDVAEVTSAAGLPDVLSAKETNICATVTVTRDAASADTGMKRDADKENSSAASPCSASDEENEQLADEQLWGNQLEAEGEVTDAELMASKGQHGSPQKTSRAPQVSSTPTKDGTGKQSLVDCWNDECSPRKAVKVAMRSPVKMSNPDKMAKSSFEATKAATAVAFLDELDAKITDGKISQLAESTGGIKLQWTKTLTTTAGRANWRKETVRTTSPDGSESSVTYKHHASIELSEKVIDDDHRLLNVLAHEFCHLANFMISGITNNPHGKEFKQWAAKCSTTFRARGITVTTKHTYEIDFKYVWKCEDCSSSYKRHSKSINTGKHRCGGCKGKLVQIKPVPRNGGKPSEYQTFIKGEMRTLKQQNPDSPQKVIMQMAAEKWASRRKPMESRDLQEDIGDVADQLLGLSLGV